MNLALTDRLKHLGPELENTRIQRFVNSHEGRKEMLWGPQVCETRCDGPDASDYLNRLTTTVPSALTHGSSCLAFLLTHKGKIRVAFDILRRDVDKFSLFCHPSVSMLLREILEMFHFSEAIEFTHCDAQQTLLLNRDHSASFLDQKSYAELRDWRGQAGLSLLICDELSAVSMIDQAHESMVGVGGYLDFERIRIGLGLAQVPNEWNEMMSPLDANGLIGITQQKGCYPGQEVIERTIALGRPTRQLVYILGTQLETEQEVHDSTDRRVGVITSVAPFDNERQCGLAIVKSSVDLGQGFKTRHELVQLSTFPRGSNNG